MEGPYRPAGAVRPRDGRAGRPCAARSFLRMRKLTGEQGRTLLFLYALLSCLLFMGRFSA